MYMKTPVSEPLLTTLLKKRLSHRCFPVNFGKFQRTPFLQNTSGRLLLDKQTVKLTGFMDVHVIAMCCLLSFQDMLNQNNSISIYHQNIQFLAITILEILNSLHRTLKGPLREEHRVIPSVQNKN